ncbi:MAG: propionyl-CoA synthetase [Gammaproteobacteria bacterium]|jgi:propionyl-CoA synthetase|nr:propionyl-CoA synthetase [Gammaproteobacteria bacterium]
MSYQKAYNHAIWHPEAFWQQQAEQLHWFKKPTTVVDTSAYPTGRWFSDGEMNTCYMALDHHVANGRADQVAIYYDSPVTHSKSSLTYAQLLEKVALFAGALRAQGVGQGDRVVIYMPMIMEAAVAMLACARLGAIHSVVFGGFAAAELATRIDDAKPKAVLTASCGIEVTKIIPYKPLLDTALDLAMHKVDTIVLLQRPQQIADMQSGRDLDWDDIVAKAAPAEAVPVKSSDPLYILYTSGTTGKPKGVMRDNGGHAVALHYSMGAIYGAQPGDVFWAASDVGWVVGHSYIVYAPLIAGCTSILYEGKPVMTPDAGAFWRVIEEYKVKAIFSAPTAFRAIKKEDPEGKLLKKYDLSSLETVFMAGERLDPPTYQWAKDIIGRPIVDHWWQTETGWSICANPVGLDNLPAKSGSATVPVPGYDLYILDNDGQPLPANEKGNIALKLPMPPGFLLGIWGDSERLHNSYLADFAGYYTSGDGGYRDEDGYVYIMGRTDDVINIAGHRLSTGEMEEVVGGHPLVAECAVVGIHDEVKGQMPLALVLLKAGAETTDAALSKDLASMLRTQIGPIAVMKQAHIVERLPKTRSGKILRKVIRNIANGEDYIVPSTIDDSASLDEIAELIGPNT